MKRSGREYAAFVQLEFDERDEPWYDTYGDDGSVQSTKNHHESRNAGGPFYGFAQTKPPLVQTIWEWCEPCEIQKLLVLAPTTKIHFGGHQSGSETRRTCESNELEDHSAEKQKQAVSPRTRVSQSKENTVLVTGRACDKLNEVHETFFWAQGGLWKRREDQLRNKKRCPR